MAKTLSENLRSRVLVAIDSGMSKRVCVVAPNACSVVVPQLCTVTGRRPRSPARCDCAA
jgi:hypothetical protein